MTEQATSNRDMADAEEAMRLANEVADRLVAEARQKVAEMANEARAKSEEIIATGRAKGEEFLTAARAKADEFVNNGRAKGEEFITAGRAKADELVAAGRAKGEEIVSEAKTAAERAAREKHLEILDSLASDRVEIEALVGKMRIFERDYRTHLLEYMEGQLAVAKAGSFSREQEPQ